MANIYFLLWKKRFFPVLVDGITLVCAAFLHFAFGVKTPLRYF